MTHQGRRMTTFRCTKHNSKNPPAIPFISLFVIDSNHQTNKGPLTDRTIVPRNSDAPSHSLDDAKIFTPLDQIRLLRLLPLLLVFKDNLVFALFAADPVILLCFPLFRP